MSSCGTISTNPIVFSGKVRSKLWTSALFGGAPLILQQFYQESGWSAPFVLEGQRVLKVAFKVQ